MLSRVRVGLVLAVIVVMGCAERHARDEGDRGHGAECDPSIYGSPCCAICHVDDAGADDPFVLPGLPIDAGY